MKRRHHMFSDAPPSEVMAQFDTLPQPIRQAIAGADFAYVPADISARLARGARMRSILDLIARQNRTLRRIAS